MLRPNYAMDPPPTSIEVGGSFYDCATDYRVWLEVLGLLEDILPNAETEAELERTAGQIMEIENLVFGGWLKEENPLEVVKAVAAFAQGYPMAPVKGEGTDAPTYSFEYDLNAIIIAIRNQSGIDLSWRRTEPFHWWEFLLEFQTLCGDHYILNLMEIRGYKGKDKDMKRTRERYALPTKYTAAERAEYEAWSALFDEPEEGEKPNED